MFIIIYFLKNPQPGNDVAFHRIFPFYGNLYIPNIGNSMGSHQLLICEVEKNMGNLCVILYFSRTM